MNSYTVEPFISKEEIAQMIQTLGKQINTDYQGQEVLLVGLLRGSVIFLADLVRELSLNATIDFMVVSSYGNSTKSSRDVKIIKDLQEDIKDRNVIVVEDIIDTGHTLKQVVDFLALREPKSLKICTLLDKPQRREVKVKVDYTGRTIPDKFVVGYGIDYAQKYRTLPDIRLVVFKEDQ